STTTSNAICPLLSVDGIHPSDIHSPGQSKVRNEGCTTCLHRPDGPQPAPTANRSDDDALDLSELRRRESRRVPAIARTTTARSRWSGAIARAGARAFGTAL